MKSMKKVIVLILFFTPIVGMEEQKIEPVVAAPQAVGPANYILQGDQGKGVVFDGKMIRELLPGLAEKFKAGFKEGEGTIVLRNFDQAGLEILKQILTDVRSSQDAFQKEITKINTEAQNKIEVIVYPPQQKQKETDERNKVMQNAGIEINKALLELAQRAQSKIEAIPKIGEYFLELFNNLILWKATPVLGKAMSLFASEQIDFGKDEEFAQLKQLDPQAQLIYLFEAHYTIENIYRAFEWFKELVGTPDITTQEATRQFLSSVSNKLVAFTVAHINETVRKYPQFKTLILDPILAPTATQLHHALMQSPLIAFEDVLMRYSQNNYPSLINLGNVRVGVVYDDALHIFDINTYKRIKKILLKDVLSGAKKAEQFKFTGDLNPNHIIAYRFNQLILFDVSENKVLINHTFRLKNNITSVNQLDENRFLVVFNLNTLKIVDIRDLNQDPKGILLRGAKQAVVFDPQHVAIYAEFSRNGQDVREIVFWNSLTEQMIRRTISEGPKRPDIKLHKISLTQCIGTQDEIRANGRFLTIYLLDAFAHTVVEIGQYEWGNAYPYPLNATSVLIQSIIQASSPLKFWHLPTRAITPFIDSSTKDVVVLNQNHIAVVVKNPYQVIIKFIPQTSTLSEILDEIQRHAIPAQPGQQAPAQPQKRPASPAREEGAIPAAAQGLRPAGYQAKQPRLEKPNG